MKKLQTEDVFKVARIIKKHNATDIIKYFTDEYRDEDISEEEAGINAVVNIASDAKVEKAFYEIMTIPFETSKDDIKKMELDTLLDGIVQMNKEQNIIRFFKLAGRLSLK